MALITPPYHFGLVVDDLEDAKHAIGGALGMTWAKTQRRTSTLESASGRESVEVCFVYSLQGPPYLELIERREGSIFEHAGLHHIGVWSDDPPAESSRLQDHGWERESVTVKPDGSWIGGLYHLGIGGLRVEIVDIGASGPKLACYLTGGDYGSPPPEAPTASRET